MDNKQIVDKATIKWILRLCNEQGYKNPSEVISAYNQAYLGC